MDLSNPGHEVDLDRGKREMADTPVSTPRPNLTVSKGRMRRATRFGFLLCLQELRMLSEGQLTSLIQLESKLNLDEILSGQELFIKLMNSPRAFARARGDLKKVFLETPALPPKSNRPEIRRIGVGYRDKGALRPSHKPRPVTRVIWSEDIPLGSHSPWADSEDNPRWISAEELFEDEQRYGPEMRFYYRSSVSTGMDQIDPFLGWNAHFGEHFISRIGKIRSGPELGAMEWNLSDSVPNSDPNSSTEETIE